MISYGLAFATGSFIYTLVEIAWRGYTHWSMTLTGGACLTVMYMWNELLASRPAPLKWLVGAVSITLIEFVVGCVVNLLLRQNVWDYSNLRFNLLGQICLSFSAMWYLISIPAFSLCDIIKKIT
ncbi:MAG: hypothetical protein IJ457_06640 [Clostridia bacterium]|nr:hypothetical protein [Clostridia bacterium]